MFRSELELQNKFINLMKQDKQDHTYISDEFNARFGNVDIVKVKYDNKVTEIGNTLSDLINNGITGSLEKTFKVVEKLIE